MTVEIHLFCDLDRTLIPNGKAPPSPGADEVFGRLVARPEVSLTYVSGRDKRLLREAIDAYGLPIPNAAVGDVGASILHPGNDWRRDEGWSSQIAEDWKGHDRGDLLAALDNLSGLELQPEDQQGRFKLSFFTEPGDREVEEKVSKKLDTLGVRCAYISSVDEAAGRGLLDVLPARATKVHAIEYLLKAAGAAPKRALFAGDSGNDLPALTSRLPAVLVANASDDVRAAAHAGVRKDPAVHERSLYCARGDFRGMNGNYAAGVLEGLAHFFPETRAWMDR